MKNIDLYQRHRTRALNPRLFRNPTCEYRGAPFWSWNNKLDRAQLLRQIDVFRDMGIGGFTIHCRTGLDTEYLGDEFMGIVRDCVRKARQRKMLCWLYDEDRWPSGFAGGLVTKNPRHRAKHLLFTCTPYGGKVGAAPNISNSLGSRRENGALLARYDVVLKDGCLAHYRRLRDGATSKPKGRIWYAYLETAVASPWFNNQTYVDTLSREAIQRFVEVTHERYAEDLQSEFGKTVPAIFTDEPQFIRKTTFSTPDETHDLTMPFTTDLLETYAAAYGGRLEDHLPELFWELSGGRASATRYRYHDHISERFAGAYADTMGAWCGKHGIALTGHMMEEVSLHSQTHALGEAMRSYRSFHIPGIDMLCDWHEYTTAKQAQSAVHQYGRSAMLSELYGVTGWEFDFVGHKSQGDWQAALGVTVRVHHLAWVSMAGEAKRDYPASIFQQSPWYKEYALVEDHFARLNTALTRGRPVVRVGVLHPIESYWLSCGPREQTQVDRDEREASFRNAVHWLLHGLVDFDFICESLLPSQCPKQVGAKFQVGAMRYDVVVVPPMRTIRSTTLERLEAFAAAGGQVVFTGEIPSLVDACPSKRAAKLAARCRRMEFSRPQLLNAVEPFREVVVRLADGAPADSLLHQIRNDGGNRYIFFCNTDRLRERKQARIRFRGRWDVVLLDTMTGNQRGLRSQLDGGWTVLEWDFPAHGHLLVRLERRVSKGSTLATRPPSWMEQARVRDPVRVTLSEPNVLLLDQAECRVDRGPWQAKEEILRLDNMVRQQLGLPERSGSIAQPWVDQTPSPVLGVVTLRFRIQCDAPVARPSLALEEAGTTRLRLDGREVPSHITGWFVDEAIQTVRLPALKRGAHTLELSLPFSRRTNLEWSYLLGDFGVALAGRHARIIAPVRTLAFGNWTTQGLPFYTGNVTYHCTLEGNGREMALGAPMPSGLIMHRGESQSPHGLTQWKVPMLSLDLDGKLAGKIAFSPFQLELGRVRKGRHRLDITAFGHRFNAFGSIHNLDLEHFWMMGGPDAWRSTGRFWAYEYQLKPMGIPAAPICLERK